MVTIDMRSVTGLISPYNALEYNFPDESHVLEFIHENQIDKRNVTAYERGEHAIAAYKIREEREAKERQGTRNDLKKDNIDSNLNQCKNEKEDKPEGRVTEILA